MPSEENPYQEKEAALNALRQFVDKYSPATKETADTFYNTVEIVNAIDQHTGYKLSSYDVYQMMTQMGFSSDTTSELEFNWLLMKD